MEGVILCGYISSSLQEAALIFQRRSTCFEVSSYPAHFPTLSDQAVRLEGYWSHFEDVMEGIYSWASLNYQRFQLHPGEYFSPHPWMNLLTHPPVYLCLHQEKCLIHYPLKFELHYLQYFHQITGLDQSAR